MIYRNSLKDFGSAEGNAINLQKIFPLFSSSKGNSTYVGDENEGILIDVGYSCKKIIDALAINKIDINAVKGIFITHEHSDHISALKVLLKKYNFPVFSMEKTLEMLFSQNILSASNEAYAINQKCVKIANLVVTAFSTPHDAADSCGYVLKTKVGKKICICTDLGEVTDVVAQNLQGSDTVLIESNYDDIMLKTGEYPLYLQKRISCKNGHLSNVQCASFVENLLHNGTRNIILGHLSQENNAPNLAEKEILQKLSTFLRDKDYTLTIAPVVTSGQAVVI